MATTATGVIMEHVAAEARPRPLRRDERFAAARAGLVRQVAEAAARLHALPVPVELPNGLPLTGGHGAARSTPGLQAIAELESLLDDVAETHPVTERSSSVRTACGRSSTGSSLRRRGGPRPLRGHRRRSGPVAGAHVAARRVP